MKKFLVEMVDYCLRDRANIGLDLSGADFTGLTKAGFRAFFGYRLRLYRDPALDHRQEVEDLMSDILPDGRYFRHRLFTGVIGNEGIVFDWLYGLMWQQGGSEDMGNIEKAKSYIATLNSEKYCGYENWRLPSLHEGLLTLDFSGTPSDMSVLNESFDQKQSRIWTSEKNRSRTPLVIDSRYERNTMSTRNVRDWLDLIVNESDPFNKGTNLSAYVRAVRSEERE